MAELLENKINGRKVRLGVGNQKGVIYYVPNGRSKLKPGKMKDTEAIIDTDKPTHEPSTDSAAILLPISTIDW